MAGLLLSVRRRPRPARARAPALLIISRAVSLAGPAQLAVLLVAVAASSAPSDPGLAVAAHSIPPEAAADAVPRPETRMYTSDAARAIIANLKAAAASSSGILSAAAPGEHVSKVATHAPQLSLGTSESHGSASGLGIVMTTPHHCKPEGDHHVQCVARVSFSSSRRVR